MRAFQVLTRLSLVNFENNNNCVVIRLIITNFSYDLLTSRKWIFLREKKQLRLLLARKLVLLPGR